MRVSIARALSVSPRILLLDEPFGALDEMTRDHLNEELLAIRQQLAWTAFFVTHSVAEAVFLSNRIIVLPPIPAGCTARSASTFPIRGPRRRGSPPSTRGWSREVSKILRSVERLHVMSAQNPGGGLPR